MASMARTLDTGRLGLSCVMLHTLTLARTARLELCHIDASENTKA